jgi:hypothetical protein
MHDWVAIPSSERTARFLPNDTNRVYLEERRGPDEMVTYTFVRLEQCDQDDDISSSHTNTYDYRPVDDNIILFHEFAFRTLWDPFGNSYNVDPVIFTCHDYTPVTDLDSEFYTDIDRAGYFDKTYNYEVFVGDPDGNDVQIMASTAVQKYNYELDFVEDYTIPDDLVSDLWEQYRIDRCCHADGEYEVWERTGTQLTSITGTQLYIEWGVGTDRVLSFNRNDHQAFIYSRYDYSGPTSIYDYQMILWVDGDEHVITAGSKTAGSDMPDDIYVYSLKIYDFNGQPVVVFGYLQFFWSSDNIARYGIYWGGEMQLTEPFVIDAQYNHEVNADYSDEDYPTLYGYGEPGVIGLEIDTWKVISEPEP